MSTRCNVIIKDETKDKDDVIYVYHHCDGYPEGVGAELKYIIENCYTEAFLNRTSIAKLLCDYPSEYGPYEMTTDIHGDIEYLYVLTVLEDGTVKYQCIDVPFGKYNYETFENCELIEECILKPDDMPVNSGVQYPSFENYQYPTKEEAIAYIHGIDDLMSMSMAEILSLFFDYINTPLNK